MLAAVYSRPGRVAAVPSVLRASWPVVVWYSFTVICRPAALPDRTMFLSQITPSYSSSGWGPVEKDMSNGEQAAADGRALTIRGRVFSKGLGAHAGADVRYILGGSCSVFTGVVGIDDEVAPKGSVIFQVWADRVKIWDSGIVTGWMSPRDFRLDIAGRQELRLIVTDAGDGRTNDHADWADAKITCKGGAAAGPVALKPGDDVAGIVRSRPAQTAFLFTRGAYRYQSIEPRDGDTFTAEPGAVLTGARVLTSFVREGRYWVATGQTQGVVSRTAACLDTNPRCAYPEDLFFDDVPLQHVVSLAQVGSGKWFFDYVNDRIYFWDDPTNHIVDTSITGQAFYGAARNVVIDGLTIEKYASLSGTAAVHAGVTGPGPWGLSWIVKNCDIRLNHGAGVFAAEGAKIFNNTIRHNGNLGISAAGESVLIENNEVSYNNFAGYDPSWQGGGVKAFGTTSLVIRRNYVHHNLGVGLATDGGTRHALYEHNSTGANTGPGIIDEIGFGAVIRYNTSDGDFTMRKGLWWGACIFILDSANVEVYGNTVKHCTNAIGGAYVYRGDLGRPYPLLNMYVHDNVIQAPLSTAAGIVSNDPAAFTRWNNRFQQNTYQLPNPNGTVFVWSNKDYRWRDWQAFGHDTSGRLQ